MKAHVGEKNVRKLSACSIVKNEAANIAKSIKSYRDFVDEIIIVDTGSTDDTVHIAEELGATVLHFKWCNDFSAAKNFALNHAHGDWIIFLDADEYFNEGCGGRLCEAIDIAERRGMNCIGCRMVNLDTDTGSVLDEAFQNRVFKAGPQYDRPIHESLRFPDEMKMLSVHKSWFFLYHTGYSLTKCKQKAERNLDMLLEHMERAETTQQKLMLHLYLSDTYHALGDWKKCLQEARSYLECQKKHPTVILGLSVKVFINVIWDLDREKRPREEIQEWVDKLSDAFPDHPETAYAQGRMLYHQHLFRQALEKIDLAMRLSREYDDTEINTIYSYNTLVYTYRGLCFQGLGEDGNAFDCYLTSLRESIQSPPVTKLLGMVRRQKKEDVQAFMQGFIPTLDDNQLKRLMAGLMANYMSDALLLCYARFQITEQTALVDTNVAAFVQAGRGKYEEAAKLFQLQYQSDRFDLSAMRALLCAHLSGNRELVRRTALPASPCYCKALGLSKEPIKEKELSDLAEFAAEGERMRGSALSIELACMVAAKLDAALLKKFAMELEKAFAFSAALAVAEMAPPDSQLLFLRGYYTFRLGHLGEAEDLLHLAKADGSDDPAADAVLETIAQRLRALRSGTGPDAAAMRTRALSLIEQGDFSAVQAELAGLRDLTEPDADWYSMAVATAYYLGQDARAALAARAGLLRFPENADLLYNAGDVCNRMGQAKQARTYYEQALQRCTDDSIREQLHTALAGMAV